MESTVFNTEPYPREESVVLELYYHASPVIITPDQTPFQIGRELISAGLCVSSEFASRQHCTIDFQGGKFVLRDFSRNGTFVQLSLANSFRVQNEITPLIGNGCFKLGAAIGVDDPERIFFKVKAPA